MSGPPPKTTQDKTQRTHTQFQDRIKCGLPGWKARTLPTMPRWWIHYYMAYFNMFILIYMIFTSRLIIKHLKFVFYCHLNLHLCILQYKFWTKLILIVKATMVTYYFNYHLPLHLASYLFQWLTRHAGSDGSMSASGSAGPGFDPWRVSEFSFENFQPRG